MAASGLTVSGEVMWRRVPIRCCLSVGWLPRMDVCDHQTCDMGRLLPHLPMDLSREEVIYFDATEMLIGACWLHYRRMSSAAEAIDAHQAAGDGTPEDLQVAIFADAGALIGSVQRLRGVVD